MKIDHCMTTSAGSREVNEDKVAFAKKGGSFCFILCDGLGGHGKGDIASSLAAETIIRKFKESASLDSFCADAFETAQSELLRKQQSMGNSVKMKTTAVVLAIEGNRCVTMHIGDSRLYRFRDGRLVSRTLDHSVPQMLVMAGEIEESEIRSHPDRNKLLKAMGDNPESFRCEKAEFDLKEGDAFLLCSDGFWEPITEFDMVSFLAVNKRAKGWLKDMKSLAEKNGQGTQMDNYSAIAVMAKG